MSMGPSQPANSMLFSDRKGVAGCCVIATIATVEVLQCELHVFES